MEKKENENVCDYSNLHPTLDNSTTAFRREELTHFFYLRGIYHKHLESFIIQERCAI